MSKITITEALAEIKTIQKRIVNKREFILGNIGHQEGVKDPLEKRGGGPKLIGEEQQAIQDLEKRVIALRLGIQEANANTNIEIAGVGRTISEWLIWRRDVAPHRLDFLNRIRNNLHQVREQAKRNGSTLIPSSRSGGDDLKPTDVVVNVDEKEISDEVEKMTEILGVLDGQLSLKNATVMIDA